MGIAVVGSINMDIVAFSDEYPRYGDTQFGHKLFINPGGKGANQATACAKLGKETIMIGRVGNDAFGQLLLDTMAGNGINTLHVGRSSSQSSGTAIITIDQTAENTMLVIKGANDELSIRDIDEASELIRKCQILLVQMEVPVETVVHAMAKAREHGILVVLDPAPAQNVTLNSLQFADVITPNRQETRILTGIDVTDEKSALAAAQYFEKQGIGKVVIKMAEKGSFVYERGHYAFVEGIRVTAVDTVGAGDSFAGALAVAMADGKSLMEAVRFATIVSALKVTRIGAQEGMPALDDVKWFIAEKNLKLYLTGV
jgi:ribokinase